MCPAEGTNSLGYCYFWHAFKCLLKVIWANPDLTSISSLHSGQITALLTVFVISFYCSPYVVLLEPKAPEWFSEGNSGCGQIQLFDSLFVKKLVKLFFQKYKEHILKTYYPFVVGSTLQVLLYLSSAFFRAPFPWWRWRRKATGGFFGWVCLLSFFALPLGFGDLYKLGFSGRPFRWNWKGKREKGGVVCGVFCFFSYPPWLMHGSFSFYRYLSFCFTTTNS